MRPPSTLAIRRAVAADAEALSALANRLFVQTFVEEFAIPYPEADLKGFLASANSPRVMLGCIEDPGMALWVAEEADRAAAYAMAGPADVYLPQMAQGDGMLHRLYIDRPWRGAGLADAFMDLALPWLEEVHSPRPWLTVWSGNLRAQRFYARHGFERVGECDYPVGAWIDHEFVMRRR